MFYDIYLMMLSAGDRTSFLNTLSPTTGATVHLKKPQNRPIMVLNTLFSHATRSEYRMKQKWDGVKGIVRKDGLVLVLVKENGDLDLPGGRVEKGETVKSALMREINEETGLQVEINNPVHKWSFHKTRDQLIKGITFQCRYLNGKVTLSDEHERYFWARIGEIERLRCGDRFIRN